jgi:hypothetical protein
VCAQIAGRAEHGDVVGQHLADEFADAVAAGAGGEVFEQQGADAPAAVRVGDEHRELGAAPGVVGALAGGHAHHPVTLDGEHGDVLVVLR